MANTGADNFIIPIPTNGIYLFVSFTLGITVTNDFIVRWTLYCGRKWKLIQSRIVATRTVN